MITTRCSKPKIQNIDDRTYTKKYTKYCISGQAFKNTETYVDNSLFKKVEIKHKTFSIFDNKGGKIISYYNELGKYHRKDGPAFEIIEKNRWEKSWWVHGKRHNDCGPSILCSNGAKSYYLNNVVVSEEEHKRVSRIKKIKSLKF